MAKAAEHLAVSKPVVSKVIADLEHVLGVRPLERDRHRAEPTIFGATYSSAVLPSLMSYARA
jgi:DNA-binding transcriptional LysR family regulator